MHRSIGWRLFGGRRVLLIVGLAIGAVGRGDALAGQAPPEARLIVDNERVTVREVSGGEAGRVAAPRARDVVRVSLAPGSVGEVVFEGRGGASGHGPARAIEVELKDHRVAPYPNTSGFPSAFPRPRVKKVFDNDRVVVWDYTWSDVPPPVHFHERDVVVVFLAEGALGSIAPASADTVVNPHSFGFTKFNAGNRAHTEILLRGEARAIVVELK